MREIKFRAWDKMDKIMMDNVYMRQVNMALIDFKRSLEGPRWTVNIECDDIILMQYTGLKDKNGKEIYEGDILRAYVYNDKWDDGAVGDVTFDAPSFRFNWKILLAKLGEKNYRKPISTICSSVGCDSDGREGGIEIIGNIYENPELLKEK